MKFDDYHVLGCTCMDCFVKKYLPDQQPIKIQTDYKELRLMALENKVAALERRIKNLESSNQLGWTITKCMK